MPPRLTDSSAVLLVKDVVKAAHHYRDAMGFAFERFWGEPPGFVILYRDKMFLMLKRANDPSHVVPFRSVGEDTCDVYFWVTEVDALHAELVRRGATIADELYDQEYGCREFAAIDLDGHEIRFGEVLKPA